MLIWNYQGHWKVQEKSKGLCCPCLHSGLNCIVPGHYILCQGIFCKKAPYINEEFRPASQARGTRLSASQ